MKILIVIAHPQKGSFNHAIADAVVETVRSNGHEPIYHDLYDEQFDPILPGSEIPTVAELDSNIARYCHEISNADGIVIIHPNWWGQPPAILKGWIDRVLRPGVAYGFLEGDTGEGVPVGLLKAKAVIVFNTSNTPEEREREVFGDPLERIWRDCIFRLCGVKSFYRKMFRVIVTSTPEERREWIMEIKEIVNQYFPR